MAIEREVVRLSLSEKFFSSEKLFSSENLFSSEKESYHHVYTGDNVIAFNFWRMIGKQNL